ncbi:ATP-dependent helicase [Nitriliruptoraceae bacterium ZYF776]|nr:ATP-dependent helicase [Profundirhabdus halotolerans]
MAPSPATPAAAVPGPAALGRGVVVARGQDAPAAWADAPRVRLDDEVAVTPDHVALLLHHAWLRRHPVVVELAADNDVLREPEVCRTPPHEVPRDFTFHRERLHFLTWANTYDARRGEPIWWHGVLAQRRGGAQSSDTHDVVLPDGRPAWVDGGPRGPVADLAAHTTDGEAVALVHRESVALGKLTVLGHDDPIDRLAPDQLAAVTHRAGPARVIAPAGSGKTRVLTARLRRLIRDRHVEPELITAVAYNTRAAAEMRERTSDLGRVSIRTLHSLALWICRMDRERQVIDERGQREILDRLVRTARIPNQDPYQPYLEALTEVRLALRDPQEVELLRGDVDGFAEVFDEYRRELDRRDLLDFDEQIYRALELLLQRPDLRRRAQRAGTHLLVDEFQDLTPAFLLLVRLVAGPSLQVFGVGDDDQTIYSYAGASPDHLVDFDRWFPGAAHHALEVNYRCPPAVVTQVDRLLRHNRDRVPKTIRAGVADRGAHHPADADAAAVHRATDVADRHVPSNP